MGHNVKTCALFIDSEYIYLTACPDDIVGNTALNEIKYPKG